MNILSVFSLCGGLGFFLYGMSVMSGSLEKMGGGRLETMLKKMTDNPVKALLLGAGVTAVIQSSSAVTVMLVGLVNSGIMTLGQSVPVILGTNIGTTMTAWILSLAGLKGDSLAITLMKPETFSLVLALIGAALVLFSKRSGRRAAGEAMLGFAVLMFGMKLMSGAVAPLADSPSFASILTAFRNPLLGVLAGAAFTALIQSSSASVGILQALALTGTVSWQVALPIILGQNIGTCITALLSSIGTGRDARRVALVHIYFNILGTALCLVGLFAAGLFGFALPDAAISPAGIALCHTVFNLLSAMVFFPFCHQLEALAVATLPNRVDAQDSTRLLDERLLLSPAIATAEAVAVACDMAALVQTNLTTSLALLHQYDEAGGKSILDGEERTDKLEDRLGTWLVQLSAKELTDSDSRQVSKVLHSIGDFERISDHAINLQQAADEMNAKSISFSTEAWAEVDMVAAAVKEILGLAVTAFEADDTLLAARVEPLEEVIDELIEEVKTRHIERLQKGQCTIELGFILADVLNNFERVSDHCSNIAISVLQLSSDTYTPHGYLENLVAENNEQFRAELQACRQRYNLPAISPA